MIVLALLAAFRPVASFAENEISFGAGVGSLYSGLGVNAALRGDDYMGYVAAGCVAIGYNSWSGAILPCGIGVGLLWTDLLTKTNNRHGIGLYAGPVGYKDNNNKEARYGLGFTYVYFLQGINNKGWNFGITPATGKENGKAKGSLLINAGYQF